MCWSATPKTSFSDWIFFRFMYASMSRRKASDASLSRYTSVQICERCTHHHDLDDILALVESSGRDQRVAVSRERYAVCRTVLVLTGRSPWERWGSSSRSAADVAGEHGLARLHIDRQARILAPMNG